MDRLRRYVLARIECELRALLHITPRCSLSSAELFTSSAMLTLCSLGTALFMPAPRGPPRCPSPRCQQTPWEAYGKFNTDVAWRGYALAIDPETAEPSLPGIEYTTLAASDPADELRTRTTTTRSDGGESCVEEWRIEAGTDVDLDGSYSADHVGGLALARLLLGEGAGGRVLEHALVCVIESDETR